MMPRKKEELNTRRYIGFGVVALQAFASLLVVVSLARMGILNVWWVLLMAGVLLGALTFTIIQLVCKETDKKPKKKSKKAKKPKKDLVKISATIVSLLVTIISLVAFYYTNSFNTLLDKISVGSEESVEEEILPREPFIVYVSGSDARNGIDEVARSDVNIVAVVNPAQGKILLVSIPRDTYVQLHDTVGIKDKLTHAGVYGIEMSKKTIEDFLNIKIDRTIKVSFDTVVKVVDELDGIEIESDAEMDLKVEGKEKYCHFTIGKQKVDGDCALRFSRERKSYTTGDRRRGENQQQVLAAIIAKLSGDKGYLLKLPTILEIAGDSFETSFLRDEISDFMRFQLETGTNWQVKSISINGRGDMQPTYSMGANLPLYVMHADAESIKETQVKIAEYLKLAAEVVEE